MAELNQGFIAGLVYNADSGAPMPKAMVSLGSVWKKGIERMTLYTPFGTEVKSIVYPQAYADDNGIFGIVFQWDASDIGDVMDSAMIDRLTYSITAWQQVDNMRIPSKKHGTLKLRPNAGGMGLPKSGAEWFFKSAADIQKAAQDIKIVSPPMLGTARTTELYYLVDVLDLPAYSSPQM
ncbi:MAG TPA: hypothetical protein VFB63_01575 [Bryobacteraceae bacterium]|jgi:hypothetical protein|nr:hypothetical protein [Bryobacteraceae bacterium]